MFQNIGELLVLLGRTLQALPQTWRQRRKVYDQLFEIGNASLLMACILSLFIGGVIALQTGPLLAERGLATLIGSVVGNSMCKELAPVMMSILIAGRIGLPLGRLPGDIAYRGKNASVFFPLGTSILISIVLSVIFYLLSHFRR